MPLRFVLLIHAAVVIALASWSCRGESTEFAWTDIQSFQIFISDRAPAHWEVCMGDTAQCYTVGQLRDDAQLWRVP